LKHFRGYRIANNQWAHTTFKLIESHGNSLRHLMEDFATAVTMSVTENAEMVLPVCSQVVPHPMACVTSLRIRSCKNYLADWIPAAITLIDALLTPASSATDF
jgi:hypothetical protein